MPKVLTDIEVFCIAQTQANKDEAKRWLDYLGAQNFDWPDEEVVSDPAFVVAMAGKRCYNSFEIGLNPNITQIRKSYVDYFDNILRSRHGSVLEHSTYTFAFEGVSRVFTAEMNRHRAGWAISEASLRFIRFDKEIPFWMPTSFRPAQGDSPDIVARKQQSQLLFLEAFKNQEEIYAKLLDVWDMHETNAGFKYKKTVTSALRRIVGLGVATGGVWTGNFRALRHVLSMRTDAAAEEEIQHVFCKVAEIMMGREPLIFGDFEHKEDGSYLPKNWKV